jgi:hypothetical protein
MVEIPGSTRNLSNWMDGWAKIHKIQFIGAGISWNVLFL